MKTLLRSWNEWSFATMYLIFFGVQIMLLVLAVKKRRDYLWMTLFGVIAGSIWSVFVDTGTALPNNLISGLVALIVYGLMFGVCLIIRTIMLDLLGRKWLIWTLWAVYLLTVLIALFSRFYR